MGASPSSPSSSSRSTRNGRRRPKSVRHNLKDHVYSMLRQCMYQLPFQPEAITEDALQQMAMAVERVEVLETQVVLTKGARSKGIYVITDGEAQVLSTQGYIIANLLPGDFFGELSTLFFIPCTATVQALEGSSLLLLKVEKLMAAIGEERVVSIGLNDYYVQRKYFDTNGTVPQASTLTKIARMDLKKIPMFSKWTEPALQHILDLVSPSAESGPITLIPPKTYVCHEEENLDEVTVITKGIVSVVHEKRGVTELDANYWPMWFGEQEHFTGKMPACSAKTITACQAISIKFSDIATVKNMYKDEVGRPLKYWNEKWRKKMGQLEKVGLTPRNSAKVQTQVLIRRLHESGIVSNAPVALYHQIALASLPKQCQDGSIVYEPKSFLQGTVGRGTGTKNKREKSKMNDSVWSMTLEDAEEMIEDDDKLLLVLKGSIGAISDKTTFRAGIPVYDDKLLLVLKGSIGAISDKTTFRAGIPVWVTSAKPVTLEAREDSLVLQISGSTLIQATHMYPDVRLNLPPTVA